MSQMTQSKVKLQRMNKEEPSFGEVEETSDETVDEKAEESTVSLSQYEKIKDDYLRLAADFDNYKNCLLYTSPSPRDLG